jgi:hypothetical protein
MTTLFRGEYDDFDGLSVVFDATAIAERYGTRGEPFETSVYRDLPKLMAAGEAIAFGTRQGSTFEVAIVLGRASGDPIDAGKLRTSGRLRLAGWHGFTYACAHEDGELREDDGPSFELAPGWYAVTITRALAGAHDPDMFAAIEVGLDAIDDPGELPTPTAIPGADGFL